MGEGAAMKEAPRPEEWLLAAETACRRGAREEIREALMLHAPQCRHDVPLPSAIDAERRIVGLLLDGDATLEDIAPATAADFFVPLHVAIVIGIEAITASDLGQTLPRIVCALRAQGVVGRDEAIVDELIFLRDHAPASLSRADIDAVIEAARRRKLCRLLRDAELELRLDLKSAGEVTAQLRERLGE